MADSRTVQKLDEKLIAEGILDPSFREDYQKVHSKLNSHMKKSGAILPVKTFGTGEKKLRKWLNELFLMGASQEKLTSYLRCGLAHLSFDFIESSYKTIDDEDLITRALLSFKNREFNKTFFRAVETKKASKPARKRKKIKPVKKKKPSKKKTIKKKIAKKKTVKKTNRPAKKRVRPKKAAKKKPAKNTRRKTRKKKQSLFVKLFG